METLLDPKTPGHDAFGSHFEPLFTRHCADGPANASHLRIRHAASDGGGGWYLWCQCVPCPATEQHMLRGAFDHVKLLKFQESRIIPSTSASRNLGLVGQVYILDQEGVTFSGEVSSLLWPCCTYPLGGWLICLKS